MLGSKTPIVTIPDNKIQLQYIGKSWGLINIVGPITKEIHRVSLAYPFVAVDKRDADTGRSNIPGLTQQVRAGTKIFKFYVPEDNQSENEIKLDPEGDLLDPHAEQIFENPDKLNVADELPDPAKICDLKLDEIKKIPVDSGFDWNTALEVERADKNRVTVVAYIESILNE